MHPSAASAALAFGPASQLLQAVLVIAVSAPLCFNTPDWLQVSLVGCCWGGLVLAGLACSWSQRRLASGLYALCLAGLSHRSLQALTDLDHNAGWMVVACAVAAGWAIGWLWTPWSAHVREPRAFSEESRQASLSPRRISRWSMWDMCGLATAVATLCWLVPRVEGQFDLLCRLAPALLGGTLISLMAVEWGWRDCWSLKQLGALALGLLAVCALCMWSAPAGLTASQLVPWVLAGPGSAIAAQGLTVLAYMAARRIDTHLAEASAA